jgi:hypothetical protein
VTAARILIAQYRSRKERTQFIRQIEQQSGVRSLKAAGLSKAFADPQFYVMLVEGDLDIAKAVVLPLISPKTPDADVAAVASAFITHCRVVAEPVVRALLATHNSLADKISRGVGASADKGIGLGDPRISTILSELEDPNVLPDRTMELAYLDQLLRTEGTYEVIVAPPYTGKTTLLAFFAAHPPRDLDIDIVSFFVVRRIGRNTINRFLDVVNGQLRHLVAEPGPEPADTDRRIYYFEQLWAAAVERAVMAEPHRRLLLIVDGLDEQESAISSLLPASIPDHVTMIVSSRPNPKNFELSSNRHPFEEMLRLPWRLKPTNWTAERRDLAERELSSVLGQTSGGPALDDVLYGTLASLGAARGPLDPHSIAQITGQSESEIASRVARSNLVASVTRSVQGDAYELGHDIFYSAVEERIDLKEWRHKIRTWVKSYSDGGWLDDTPQFILEQYPQTLGLDELAQLITIEFRARVRACLATEHHLSFAIRNAIANQLDSRDSVNLRAIGKLTLHRLDMTEWRSRIPTELIKARIVDGRLGEAYRLAHEMPESLERVLMLIAMAAATTNHREQVQWSMEAQQAAGRLVPAERVEALLALANANPRDRQRLLTAAEAAASAVLPRNRASTLLAIANANPAHRERLLTAAERCINDVLPWKQADTLVALALSSPQPVDRERLLAAAEAAATEREFVNGDVLVSIANAKPDDRERLLTAAAAAVADASSLIRDKTLLAIANAKAPPALLERLEASANLSPHVRANFLLALAEARPQDRQRLLSAAEAAAEDLQPWERPEWLAALAKARPEDRERLLSAIEASVDDLLPWQRPGWLIALAEARPEDRERLLSAAEAAVEDLERWWDRGRWLVALAEARPEDRERLLSAAEASELGWQDRFSTLLTLASADPPPPVLERLLAAAELEAAASRDPAQRMEDLLAVANAYPQAIERVLAEAESNAANLDPFDTAGALLAIADAKPPAEVVARLLATAEAIIGRLEVSDRATLLLAIVNAKPPTDSLTRIEAAADDLEPSDRVSILLAIAAAKPDDRQRLLLAAEDATEAIDLSNRGRMLIDIADANPPPDLLRRLLVAAEVTAGKLAPEEKAHLLLAIAARTNQGDRRRLIELARAAAAHLRPWLKALVLLSVAKVDPMHHDRLVTTAAEAAAAEPDPWCRAQALWQTANADPGNREHLLTATVEAAADIVNPSSRAQALQWVADADPPLDLLTRLVEMATELDQLEREELLVAIANARPPPGLLARIEAAADDLQAGRRGLVLLAVARASTKDRERILAKAVITDAPGALAEVVRCVPDLWSLVLAIVARA